MEYKIALYITLLLVLAGCSNSDNNVKRNISDNVFPTYIDTIQLIGIKNYSVFEMQESRVKIISIDTFDFRTNKIDLNEIHYNHEYLNYGFDRRKYLKKELNDSSLKILIDTSYKITSYKNPSGLMEDCFENDELFESIDFDSVNFNENISVPKLDSSDFISYYPVYIINKSDSVIAFTYQSISGLLAVQEAQDSLGEWKHIEYWHRNWCGNTYSQCYLKPKYYIFSKIKVYSGNFKTNIRLKIKILNKFYYSESFIGSINYSQFKIPDKNINKENLD